MKSLLNAEQHAWLSEERRLLSRLADTLADWDADDAARRRLRDAAAGLDELFLLVVVGEFNAGKSAFINALLGGRHLTEGVTPTTRQVQVLVHGADGPPTRRDGVWRVTVPADLLREMHIVDTPGTNAIQREHEALTHDFVPRADLVLFVTSADRPFTESERVFLQAIRTWGKKIVVVVNKVDLLDDASDLAQVVTFVRRGVRALIGDEPTLFPLSARGALLAAEAGDTAALDASGLPAFEAWLDERLTHDERVRLKLENPLGVADRVAKDAEEQVSARLTVLRADSAALDAVDRALEVYQSDLREQLGVRLAQIDNLILTMRERGEAFIDDQFRLLRIRQLLDADGLQTAFEASVVADTPSAVEKEIDALVDWVIDREQAQWQAVRAQLAHRAASDALREAALTDGSEGFATRRRNLLERVERATHEAVGDFDAARAGARLTDEIQDALKQTGMVAVGALGLGIVLKALLVSAAADMTGMLAAGMLAVFGLTLIPYRRRQAAEALRARTQELRTDLRATLTETFERELRGSVAHMLRTVEPYGRFVRAETETLTTAHREITDTQEALADLAARVNAGR